MFEEGNFQTQGPSCSSAVQEPAVSRLDRAMKAMAAAAAEALTTVAELDDEKRWHDDGATSMTAWIAARYGLAWGTAREWVRVAHALRSLPSIAAAYTRAELSWDQLRVLTRFATPETDQTWAKRAPDMTPAALHREAARHQRMSEKDANDLHRRRYLSMWWDHEVPLLYVEGALAGDQGALVKEALEQRANSIVLADEPVSSPQEARLADALVELAAWSGGQEDSAPATVVVHVEASMLTGEKRETGPWLAEVETGARLASEAVRRLACDGRIEWMLERAGRPVGIGRRGRVVPGAVMRALRFRDRGCRFPGCNRRAFVHAHHLVHWADGGGTDLDNLVLLCHAHHRLIHEGGWRTNGHPASALRFHNPRGKPVRARAP